MTRERSLKIAIVLSNGIKTQSDHSAILDNNNKFLLSSCISNINNYNKFEIMTVGFILMSIRHDLFTQYESAGQLQQLQGKDYMGN